MQPLEAALQHLAHHGVVVAGRQSLGLDVELAVLVLDETFGAGDDHGADRVGALDVAVVVDLDPLRRLRQAERGGHRLQAGGSASRCRRACGRAPRAHWSAHARPAPSSRRACGTETSTLKPALTDSASASRCGLLDLVRQQDQSWRRLVVVELREERAQHFLRREGLLGAREIGAVAPVLPGAEEEHLDAGIAAFLVDREHVGFFHRARIDALLRLDRRQRGEAVAIDAPRSRIRARRRPSPSRRPVAASPHGCGRTGIRSPRAPVRYSRENRSRACRDRRSGGSGRAGRAGCGFRRRNRCRSGSGTRAAAP